MLFEAYKASRPLVMNETEEEQWEREEREFDRFPLAESYGFASRDGPEIAEMHERNKRDAYVPV